MFNILFRNKKNKKLYLKLCNVINVTNKNDGQKMYLYINLKQFKFFVRECSEFNEKFEKIS